MNIAVEGLVLGLELITSGKAAKMLGVDPETLRRHEKNGYLELYGYRIRVLRTSNGPHGQRRYDLGEIRRMLAEMQRG